MVRTLLLALALLNPAWAASSQQTDAEVLAEKLPSMELWSDDRLKAIYAPYLECYARSVESGKESHLRDDPAVLRSLEVARERCLRPKHQSNVAGSEYLASFKPMLSESERETLLRHFRRQMGFFALADRYRRRGRISVFQAYLQRLGKEARLGRSPTVLTAE